MKQTLTRATFLLAMAVLAIANQPFLLRSNASAVSAPLDNPNLENSGAAQERFDPNSYYRLTTEWQGEDRSLDIVNDGKSNNRLALAKTGNFSGQFWKITPLGNGYYRLTTQWQGSGKSLDIINDGKNNNQLILAKTGNFSGQSWKITPLSNGYYRLTTQWQGDGKSLDIVNDGKNNNQPILADTGNVSGQHWKITKVK